MKNPLKLVFVTVWISLGLVACEQTEAQPPEINVAAIEQNLVTQELGCNSTVTGELFNSFRFAAKQGYHFHFVAKARNWIFLDVRDENTGETLWSGFDWSQLNITIIPEEHTTYRIFIGGINHSLSLNCEWPIKPHCTTWETVDENGKPYNSFYAVNVDSYEEGKKLLAEIGNFIKEDIQTGTCASIASGTLCPTVWTPICGDSPDNASTWGNLCEFKRHIVKTAGEDKQWKGSWSTGECNTPHCVMWETVDINGTPLQNFYAEQVNSHQEGEKALAQVGDYINESIRKGTCEEVALSTPCTRDCPRVCTDTPARETVYCNVCEFKTHVIEMAGKNGQWKGHWENGQCKQDLFCGGIAGIECPEGYKCVLDGTYPDAGGICTPYSCKYDGNEYVSGESFPATDGCNKCSCTDTGLVACTKMFCPKTCDPKEELWRDYKSLDPKLCSLMKFSCAEGNQPFFNKCGCGCQPIKCNPDQEPSQQYVSHDVEQCKVIRFTCDTETQAYFWNDCGCGCEIRQ